MFSRLLHYGLIFCYGSILLLGLLGWALRFGLYLLWCDDTRTRFPEVHPHGRPVLPKRPWSLRGSRGYAPMGADGGVCRLLYAVYQMLSHGPCTGAVHGAPGHNRWGVVETPLPVKTQGGTMNCYFNLLIFPPSTAQCLGFKCRTRTHSDFGGHGSKLQEWSAPVNGAVLGVRRHSKA